MQHWIVGLIAGNVILVLGCGALGFVVYEQSQRVDVMEMRLSILRSEIGTKPNSALGALSLWGALDSSIKSTNLFVEIPAQATAANVRLLESEVRLLKLEQSQLWQSLGGQINVGGEVRVNCFKSRIAGRIECREP